MKINLTKKQYEVLGAIVNKLSNNLECRELFTKQKHCSRKNEFFNFSISWKSVRILTHCKKQFNRGK